VVEVIAQNVEGPYEGPTVGMQLGRGHVDLCEQRALEPRKWQAKLDPLEDGRIHEEEMASSWVGVIVSAHRFTFLTRQNQYVHVVLPPENTTLLISFTYVMKSWLEMYLEVFAKRSLGAYGKGLCS